MSAGQRTRVTLRDVAERAGVSTTTASFVLSGRRDMRISPATEERVVQAARTLDYRRRLVPRTPLPPGAPAIGVISDVVATEHFAGEMLRGCVAAATDQGHVVLMADSEGVDALEVSAVGALLGQGVRKFVYATMATAVHTVPQVLRGQRLVTMNNVDPTLEVPAVIPDDARAGRDAARALAEAGHTTGIWLVGQVLPRAPAARRRLTGVRAGLRAVGLRLAGHLQCGWWPDETRRALGGLFEAGWWERERPTAVIAMNDRAAMGVYQAAAAAGRRIPEDLSVISFDNSDLARWLHPALSSMDLPYFDLGRRAVELLLADEAEPRVRKLPMELRARASTARRLP
ncbi:LacI family transcriptional regulator [Nonomuraea solani]|uniref:LacI family transcriptional regulator n=1 Tax=Nonomuraea solani TaxID=1144553 RepID=A0A1H5VRK7_9ACTN|nr:LacI family DNA-binding transcriptional regulator [Nonomuraea solani]SEF89939.1 LacI family transcriptional regulator [Nonomuraea solani]